MAGNIPSYYINSGQLASEALCGEARRLLGARMALESTRPKADLVKAQKLISQAEELLRRSRVRMLVAVKSTLMPGAPAFDPVPLEEEPAAQ